MNPIQRLTETIWLHEQIAKHCNKQNIDVSEYYLNTEKIRNIAEEVQRAEIIERQ
jgi:flavorubredoxin